jgi:hypothetical protein
MDASENISQSSRLDAGGPGRGTSPTAFSGTVIGVKKDEGKQTLEVQYSQGKIRFQAEGDFQVGEKVRLSFPGNGSVQVEKGAPQGAQGDWQGVGYTLPQNLNALKDLRGFEEQLVRWMGARQQPGGPQNPQEKNALARLSLPQLLMQAMEKQGGKEFLSQALAGMDPAVASALLDAMEQVEGDPGAKAALTDLLRSPGRGPDSFQQAPARQAAGPGALLPAESGAGHAPGFGRNAE